MYILGTLGYFEVIPEKLSYTESIELVGAVAKTVEAIKAFAEKEVGKMDETSLIFQEQEVWATKKKFGGFELWSYIEAKIVDERN